MPASDWFIVLGGERHVSACLYVCMCVKARSQPQVSFLRHQPLFFLFEIRFFSDLEW